MITKNIQCSYCGHYNHKELYSVKDMYGDNYIMRECDNCNAIFLSPPPTKEQLARAYDNSYYGQGEEKFNSSFVELILDYFRNNRAKKIAKQLPENAKVLDIGCGNGNFLNYLPSNFKLYGIELNENSTKRASKNKNIHLKIGELQEEDFQNNFFDAITLFHVFEHLTEPEKTLDIIDKILKPKGLLILSFPNIDSWQSRYFKSMWLHLDPPRHLFFFNPKDFIKLMEKRAYKLNKICFVSAEQNPFGMIQSILNLWCKKRDVLFERLKGNNEYSKEYGKFNVLLQKTFFIILFPFFIITDIIASIFGKSATVKFCFSKI